MKQDIDKLAMEYDPRKNLDAESLRQAFKKGYSKAEEKYNTKEFIFMIGKTFEIKDDHLKLLKNSYVVWRDCEFGAPAIDCKRPYGNTDVESDIAEILNWNVSEDGLTEEQKEQAYKLHRELEIVLEIVLATQSFQPGVYNNPSWYTPSEWIKVK